MSVHPALLPDTTLLFALQKKFCSSHKSYSCHGVFFHLRCLYLNCIQSLRQIEELSATGIREDPSSSLIYSH